MLEQKKPIDPRAKIRWPATMLIPQAKKVPDHKTVNLNGKILWSTTVDSGKDDLQF